MKKFLLGILLGIIISYSVVYAASTLYSSSEVSYTPSDSSWSVGNVKEALDNLKSTSGTALTDLKNTSIAKAVSANGSSLSSVINTLGGISNKGDLTKTINPGGSVSIAAGYYSGGKITANANQNSGTYTPSAHGTALDMGVNNTYRYVNTTNVWNQAVAAADARVNTASANYKAGYNAGKAVATVKVRTYVVTGAANDSNHLTVTRTDENGNVARQTVTFENGSVTVYSDGYFAIWCHDWIWEFVATPPYKLNGNVDKSGAKNITGFYTTNSATSNTIIVPVF